MRTAQESAISAGDMVFCRDTNSTVDSNGDVVELPNSVTRYYIIARDIAKQADAEKVGMLKAEATDFVFGNNISAETRSVLAIHARAVSNRK